jgi:hypothetical protein
VVIKDRQGVAASGTLGSQRDMPLEIHLPEPIRCFVFESFGRDIGCVDMRNKLTAMPTQNGCNRVGVGFLHVFR